jgi:hypothetical protein
LDLLSPSEGAELEVLGWGRAGAGMLRAVMQQKEHRTWWRQESQVLAQLCPASYLGKFINSLIHSSTMYHTPTACMGYWAKNR